MLEKVLRNLRCGHFLNSSYESYTTIYSLKEISHENGRGVIFVMSRLATFLLLKHPQSTFLPSSLKELHILKIWSMSILIHLFNVSVSLWWRVFIKQTNKNNHCNHIL